MVLHNSPYLAAPCQKPCSMLSKQLTGAERRASSENAQHLNMHRRPKRIEMYAVSNELVWTGPKTTSYVDYVLNNNNINNNNNNNNNNEKKRQYSRRVLEVEQGTFTPLVFTSTGGMATDECKRFCSRLTELLALKKGDDYATTISWIRAKVSFAILRSALLCLRGTRSKRRAANISDIDITSESVLASQNLNSNIFYYLL